MIHDVLIVMIVCSRYAEYNTGMLQVGAVFLLPDKSFFLAEPWHIHEWQVTITDNLLLSLWALFIPSDQNNFKVKLD